LPALSPPPTIGPETPSRKGILAEHRARPASPAGPAPFGWTTGEGWALCPTAPADLVEVYRNAPLRPAEGVVAAATQLGPAPLSIIKVCLPSLARAAAPATNSSPTCGTVSPNWKPRSNA